MMNKDKLTKLDEADRLHWNSKGKPWRRTFIDDYKGQPLKSLWYDIRVIHHMSDERLGYPTQKPEALLERMITLVLNQA
jgi:DNA modification methylase